MAPAKRKRGERTFSQDNVNDGRPSPHRPENLPLAQVNGNAGGRGGRRSSRGGRGGGQTQNETVANPQPATPTPVKTAMSPPPPPPAPAAVAKLSQFPQKMGSQTPNLQPPPPNGPPRQDPSIYHYDFVTPERVQAWSESGRQAVIDDALAKVQEEDFGALGGFFQEVIHLVADALINPQAAGTLVRAVLENSSVSEEMELPSQFLDTFSVVFGHCWIPKGKVTGNEELLRSFIAATNIDQKLVCQVLDDHTLVGLQLVRVHFDRVGIRHATNALYRQSGYNLLREESEGYSKLMTEYFTVTHNFKPDKETVEDTWEQVKALIGAFDLDVGRVLDITLDVFANNMIKHNKFFIRLLRASDWWPQAKTLKSFTSDDHGLSTLPLWSDPNYSSLEPLPQDLERIAGLRHGRDILFWERVRQSGMQAFFELGGRRAVTRDGMDDAIEEIVKGDVDKEAESEDEWTARTRTFPPSGNSLAAQILGFKLSFYASEARDKNDRLPDNLIWLAALLIKLGFISLRDLYPHIYPSDDAMDEVKEKLEKDREDKLRRMRPGGGTNALTMAGALADGENSSFSSSRVQDLKGRAATPSVAVSTATPAGSTPPVTEAPKDVLPEPTDQKILLLKSLLLIGAMPDALFILGRFPWLLDLHEDLPRYINRILHHMLKKVYSESQPLGGRESLKTPSKARVDINNSSVLEPRKEPRSIAWGQLEKIEWSEGDYGTGYRFYWDDWNDLVPICQTVDDVFTLCESFLNIVGHKIGQDSDLLTKLVRIGVKSLKEDTSSENFTRWQKLAKRLLIPALSLTKEDPGTVNEAWELLKLFPVAVRFNIYAEWYGGQTSRLPVIKLAFDVSRSQTKDVLKRISRTNIKAMARALAKVAYSSPGIALTTALNQIEAYNNLIEVVIECVRYFTNIGFDVLIWSLLNALGGGSRNRMQADGMLTSKWLQRLGEFTGKVSKRYYKDLDLKPLLLYVEDQLEQGNSTDLGILGQMVLSMGGIPVDQTWSEEQVVAMAGRIMLRTETLKRMGDKRLESKSTAARLMDALTSTGLAGKLLILIALERQKYLERESSSGAPIKVLSANLTQLQYGFVQYLDFLRTNYSVPDFDAAVPGLEHLIANHGIEPGVAFTIARPSILYEMEQANKATESAKVSPVATNGDVEMTDNSAPTTNGNAIEKSAVNGSSDDLSMTDVPSSNGLAALPSVLQQVVQRLRGALPTVFEESMSLPFYVRFWQLSLSDVIVSPYDDEIKNIRNTLQTVTNDRSDISASGTRKKEARKKELQQMDKDMATEWRAAINHTQSMRKILKDERWAWFPNFPPAKHQDLTNAILQECILPRIALSEMDALFTAKFIFTVHKLSTPSFRIAKILARIFHEHQFVAILSMMTEREAKNMGIFLKEVLSQLRLWRENKSLYDKEGSGPNNENPGFAKKFQDDNTVDSSDTDAVLDHADYQRLLFKWHTNLDKAIMHCLQSEEFMHIRNAIFLLKQVVDYFPALNFQGTRIMEQVQKLAQNETREDLKLSAMSLQADLKKQRMKWIPAASFRPGDGPPAALAKSESKSGSTRPSTPMSGSAAKPSLNVAVSEFMPSSSSAGAKEKDEEDGEIDDAKIEKVSTTTEPAPVTEANATAIRPRVPPADKPRASTPSAPNRSTPVPVRTQENRPATPVSGSTSVPTSNSRQDNSRPVSSGNPISLPPRPEGPIPSHRELHQRPDRPGPPPPRHEARDARDTRDARPAEQYGRLDRPAEPAREPLRRRESPGLRNRNRSPDGRLPRPEHDRRDQGYGPPRDPLGRGAPPPRDPRDDRYRERDTRGPLRDSRGPLPPVDAHGRSPRQPLEPPMRESGPPTITRERLPLPPQSEAAAAATGGSHARGPMPGDLPFSRDSDRRNHDSWMEEERRHGHRRGQTPPRDDRPPVGGSRGTSPHGERRSERAGAERPPPRSGPRDRELAPTPSAPLADRMIAGGRNSDLFSGSSASRTPVEPSHGRLSHDTSRSTQDPNYGRLGPSNADTPSGPRSRPNGLARNSRPEPPSLTPSGPRNPNMTSPNHVPQSPSVDRAPPSGPMGGNRRISTNTNYATPATTPQAPVPESKASHGPPPPSVTDNNNSSPSVGIHPSRLVNISANSGPPPIQTNIPTGPGAGPQSSGVPSGPRAARPLPSPSQANMPAPSPTGRYPPTGPSSAGGSARGRSQIGIINNLIREQPSRDTGTSIRGRASLTNQGSAPASPVTATPPVQFPRADGPPAVRTDSLADRIEGPPSMGSEDHRGSGRRGSGRGADDGSERGSRRHHRSRSRGDPRRDAADNAMRAQQSREDMMAPRGGEDRRRRDENDREPRDRRSRGGHHGDRDRERDSHRDSGGSRRESRTSSRNEDRGTTPSQFGLGNPPPPPPPPGMPLSMNGDRRRDDRRDSGKRRRPGDDGMGMGMHPDSKRPRRGQ